MAGAGLGLLLVVMALLGWRHHGAARRTSMLRGDPDTILADPHRRKIALADGRAVFRAHCAACHGKAGQGDPRRAMPDLTDRDFLYGEGKTGQIEQIVLHGIRAGDSRGWDQAEMPAYARPVPYRREPLLPLKPGQIRDLVAFLRAANGSGGYAVEQIVRGRRLFATSAGCWDCHGSDASGDAALGAPDLVDGKWLKGNGSEADLTDVIERGMAGVSPAFSRILSPYEARVVSAYTASLHPPVP